MTRSSTEVFQKMRLATTVAATCTLLLGLATEGVAQQGMPPIKELAAVVAARHPDLVAQRASLLNERQALHAKNVSYNAACSAVEEGSAQETSCRSAGSQLQTEIKLHLRRSADFNAMVRAASVADAGPLPFGDASVVDAREVPTGLPKSVEAEIPDTPAGSRVRKGFQAIMGHDWNVAHAWFQDALNHDKGNVGIERLVELAEYSMKHAGKRLPALPQHAPVTDTGRARDKSATEALGRQLDEQMSEEVATAIRDFNESHPEPKPEKIEPNWKAFFDAIFEKGPRRSEVGAVRD
jgi:hypothetical protein